MRDELTQSLKESTAEVKKPDEATGYSQHQADQGTDDFDRTITLGTDQQRLHHFAPNRARLRKNQRRLLRHLR